MGRNDSKHFNLNYRENLVVIKKVQASVSLIILTNAEVTCTKKKK